MENFQAYQQEETIDLKALFFKFTRFWYLFAISIFIALLVAFLFNKYTKPIYEVKTTVLVKDDKTKLDPSALIGFGLSGQQNLQNEIGILMSHSLSDRVIKELGFEVSYFLDEGFVSKELYHTVPFTVEIDFDQPQAVTLSYAITFLNNNNYRIEAEGENISIYDFQDADNTGDKTEKIKTSGTYFLGEWVDNGLNKFRITLSNSFDPEEDPKRITVLSSMITLHCCV